ncbi:hypothetical protein NIES37_01920 [Tolypothrix tenuis PCC 7101]|uniref:Transposase IS200-like domain-containing protein n=1 Tax=Tolypothrix tenuis PCC 7101 TaxID=231146 RepID=A0A1Z4MS45_9CYAN|nr:transposase [Aulosira sp. FACHB-113]BAY96262.1 hypothetical protein NIES37_01920 [Tolypothrix tenuis PCC 7101]BAZ73231.1 hypothetical protein NIES50_17920 [Aulosira laxa NIES-50]
MTNYRRIAIAGGTYFFTQVTHERYPWLCYANARALLRQAIIEVRQKYPFTIDALVLLPDHIHCIWTLPPGDSNYAKRWRLIKTYATKNKTCDLEIDISINESREKRIESNLWQRRFWEHWIRNEADFIHHCDYIHYNPVKHGFCSAPSEWPYSSFHRFVAQGIYPANWGETQSPKS